MTTMTVPSSNSTQAMRLWLSAAIAVLVIVACSIAAFAIGRATADSSSSPTVRAAQAHVVTAPSDGCRTFAPVC